MVSLSRNTVSPQETIKIMVTVADAHRDGAWSLHVLRQDETPHFILVTSTEPAKRDNWYHVGIEGGTQLTLRGDYYLVDFAPLEHYEQTKLALRKVAADFDCWYARGGIAEDALRRIIDSQPPTECDYCQGTGQQQEFECSACGGDGFLYDEQAWIAYTALNLEADQRSSGGEVDRE